MLNLPAKMPQFYQNLTFCWDEPKSRVPAPTFYLFTSLPIEIRFMVWDVLIVPRIIDIEGLYITSNPRLRIPLLAACKESREYALKFYKPWGEFRAPLGPVQGSPGHCIAPAVRVQTMPFAQSRALENILKDERKPFFSYNYVDFENDILVIDDEFVLGDIDRDGRGALGKSSFQYNENKAQLNRVRNVALAYTHWMLCLAGLKDEGFWECPYLLRWWDRIARRSIFRFRGLRMLTIINYVGEYDLHELKLESNNNFGEEYEKLVLEFFQSLLDFEDTEVMFKSHIPRTWKQPKVQVVDLVPASQDVL